MGLCLEWSRKSEINISWCVHPLFKLSEAHSNKPSLAALAALVTGLPRKNIEKWPVSRKKVAKSGQFPIALKYQPLPPLFSRFIAFLLTNIFQFCPKLFFWIFLGIFSELKTKINILYLAPQAKKILVLYLYAQKIIFGCQFGQLIIILWSGS